MPAKKKLSEKADKRYRAKITIPETGKKIYVSGRTRAELEREKARVKAALIDGVSLHDMPFCDLIVEWFETVKKPKIKTASTLHNWQVVIDKHVLPCFDERWLAFQQKSQCAWSVTPTMPPRLISIPTSPARPKKMQLKKLRRCLWMQEFYKSCQKVATQK